MPLVTIDEQVIEVEPGTLIIQAADRLGIEVPRFCSHPDLRPEGNCRMCLVEVKGYPRLAVACATPVVDGMVVRTPHTSEQASAAVRGVLEFLLLNHPVDCPICDQAGECSLQDFYMHPHYGLHRSQVDLSEKVRKRKAIDLGPRIVLDSERCVMCSRCVRFCAEVTGTGELQFAYRGNHVELQAFEDRALTDPYAGNLADICPVGALTSKDFRFKVRVWHLDHTDSICAGCSTGCNLRIDHYKGTLERLVPRRNPAVNRSWLCDEGRLSYQRLAFAPRLLQPCVRLEDGSFQETAWDAALDHAHRGLHTARTGGRQSALAALVSTSATNEAMLQFRRYVTQSFTAPLLDCRLDQEDRWVEQREDTLLRRRDKHPNTRGALLLGLAPTPEGGLKQILEHATNGALDAVLILYYPPLVHEESSEVLERLAALLQAVPFSVVLTTHEEPWWRHASVVLPVSAWSEEEGTYTNFAGEVQAVDGALRPPGRARSATAVLTGLLRATGRLTGDPSAAVLFRELTAVVPSYAGLEYYALTSRQASVYPPEGRKPYGQEGFAGH
jgi:NADH-quinone oxidoreductase subunit G